MIDEAGVAKIETGEFKVFIGGSAPMQRSLDLGASQYVEGDFFVK